MHCTCTLIPYSPDWKASLTAAMGTSDMVTRLIYHSSCPDCTHCIAVLLAVLQGLLQQVLGGNEDVVVTAGRKAPAANDAFFQLEVSLLPACYCGVQPGHSSSSGISFEACKRMSEVAIDSLC